MADPIRITVLGTGRIGAMHAELIARRIDGAELAGVFDVHAPAAQAVGAELGVPVYSTLDDALAAPADQCASPRAPTPVTVMQAAAQAGRAIFCEKPISLDVAQVDAGLAAVGEACSRSGSTVARPSHAASPMRWPGGRRADRAHHEPRAGLPPISYIEVSGGIFNDMTIPASTWLAT